VIADMLQTQGFLPAGGLYQTSRSPTDRRRALTIRFVEIYDVMKNESLRKDRENRVKTTDREAYFGDRLDDYQPRTVVWSWSDGWVWRQNCV